MLTIYKYEIPKEEFFDLQIPAKAQILSVQTQSGEPVMWVILDSEAETVKRSFCLVGTGHEINPGFNLSYIGTVQLLTGALVFHLFELLRLTLE